jgi:hypothetical protein
MAAMLRHRAMIGGAGFLSAGAGASFLYGCQQARQWYAGSTPTSGTETQQPHIVIEPDTQSTPQYWDHTYVDMPGYNGSITNTTSENVTTITVTTTTTVTASPSADRTSVERQEHTGVTTKPVRENDTALATLSPLDLLFAIKDAGITRGQILSAVVSQLNNIPRPLTMLLVSLLLLLGCLWSLVRPGNDIAPPPAIEDAGEGAVDVPSPDAATVAEIEAARHARDAALKKMNDLRDEHASCTRTIDDLKKEKRGQVEKIASLIQRVSKLEDTENELRESSKSDIVTKHELRLRLQASHAAISELKKSSQKEEHEHQLLKSKHSRLENDRVARLIDELEKPRRIEVSNSPVVSQSDLESLFDDQKQEFAELKDYIQSIQQSPAQITTDHLELNQKHEKELAAKDRQIAKLDTKSGSLNSDVNHAYALVRSEKASTQSAESKREGVEKKLVAKDKELNELEKKLIVKSSELQHSKSNEQDLKDRLTAQSEELKFLREMNASGRVMNAALQTERDAAVKKAKELQETNEGLLTDMKDIMQKILEKPVCNCGPGKAADPDCCDDDDADAEGDDNTTPDIEESAPEDQPDNEGGNDAPPARDGDGDADTARDNDVKPDVSERTTTPSADANDTTSPVPTAENGGDATTASINVVRSKTPESVAPTPPAKPTKPSNPVPAAKDDGDATTVKKITIPANTGKSEQAKLSVVQQQLPKFDLKSALGISGMLGATHSPRAGTGFFANGQSLFKLDAPTDAVSGAPTTVPTNTPPALPGGDTAMSGSSIAPAPAPTTGVGNAPATGSQDFNMRSGDGDAGNAPGPPDEDTEMDLGPAHDGATSNTTPQALPPSNGPAPATGPQRSEPTTSARDVSATVDENVDMSNVPNTASARQFTAPQQPLGFNFTPIPWTGNVVRPSQTQRGRTGAQKQNGRKAPATDPEQPVAQLQNAPISGSSFAFGGPTNADNDVTMIFGGSGQPAANMTAPAAPDASALNAPSTGSANGGTISTPGDDASASDNNVDMSDAPTPASTTQSAIPQQLPGLNLAPKPSTATEAPPMQQLPGLSSSLKLSTSNGTGSKSISGPTSAPTSNTSGPGLPPKEASEPEEGFDDLNNYAGALYKTMELLYSEYNPLSWFDGFEEVNKSLNVLEIFPTDLPEWAKLAKNSTELAKTLSGLTPNERAEAGMSDEAINTLADIAAAISNVVVGLGGSLTNKDAAANPSTNEDAGWQEVDGDQIMSLLNQTDSTNGKDSGSGPPGSGYQRPDEDRERDNPRNPPRRSEMEETFDRLADMEVQIEDLVGQLWNLPAWQLPCLDMRVNDLHSDWDTVKTALENEETPVKLLEKWETLLKTFELVHVEIEFCSPQDKENVGLTPGLETLFLETEKELKRDLKRLPQLVRRPQLKMKSVRRGAKSNTGGSSVTPAGPAIDPALKGRSITDTSYNFPGSTTLSNNGFDGHQANSNLGTKGKTPAHKIPGNTANPASSFGVSALDPLIYEPRIQPKRDYATMPDLGTYNPPVPPGWIPPTKRADYKPTSTGSTAPKMPGSTTEPAKPLVDINLHPSGPKTYLGNFPRQPGTFQQGGQTPSKPKPNLNAWADKLKKDQDPNNTGAESEESEEE